MENIESCRKVGQKMRICVDCVFGWIPDISEINVILIKYLRIKYC
jgi:hypothetical protein